MDLFEPKLNVHLSVSRLLPLFHQYSGVGSWSEKKDIDLKGLQLNIIPQSLQKHLAMMV